MESLIIVTPAELSNLIETGIRKVLKETAREDKTNRTYSISQVAKELHRSHTTIKNLIRTGQIKTISNGRRIKHQAVEDYLQGNPG
jgi:transposase